jgi:hypothetical protein
MPDERDPNKCIREHAKIRLTSTGVLCVCVALGLVAYLTYIAAAVMKFR